MLNTIARFLLVSTALAPVLGAVAVNQAARGEPWMHWGSWLVVALLLVFLCWAMLRFAAKNAQTQVFHIKAFERTDKEVLAFLLAYLLPFVSQDSVMIGGSWLVGAYVLGIIFLVIAHAGAFHFNPVMGLLGYHFYAVNNDDGVTQLLISKAELRKPGFKLRTVHLARGIYLDTGKRDV